MLKIRLLVILTISKQKFVTVPIFFISINSY